MKVKVVIPRLENEITRLPNGFQNESICIKDFSAASDRIQLEATGRDGVSYDKALDDLH